MHKPRVLLTGGTGFVGRHLLAALTTYDVTAIGRKKVEGDTRFVHKELTSIERYEDCLDNIDVVVHCAARSHVMKEESVDPLSEYRKVNVDGTVNLARHAAAASVKRFIFVSSIKVNGEQTTSGESFTMGDIPAPQDAYGISKCEAEMALRKLASESNMEVVIIRPPLVYGSGVKGNFASMMKLIQRGFPLPLGSVHNQRSLVAIDNLVDLIVTCIDHPAAANQTFLVSDDHDLSTTELFRALGKAAGKPARLLPVPNSVLRFGAKALGKTSIADRLLGSLQVDISHTREMLGWTPSISVEEGMRRCFKKPSS